MTETNTEQTITVPDNAELIDDVFYVWKTRFGLLHNNDKRGTQNVDWWHS